ncbi:MAG: ATP-binding protein, partial [Clostridia bacterium]
VQQLWRSQWVADHQTVLVTGTTGVGKTYVLCALGHAACRRRYHVTYLRVPRLLGEATVAKTTGQWLHWLQRLRRRNLLLLDDWGLSPFTVEESHDLFEVLDDRYQVRATAIAGQVPVTQWPSLFPDATVGEAILDRLVHQAVPLPLTGESMRKVLATASRSGTTDPTPIG